MRILHLSDQGLPDGRIEKSAYSARKLGHSVFFAGGRCNGYSLEVKGFDAVFELPFTWRANLGEPLHWHRLRRKFATVLSEVKPDLIHANNIICARLASQTGLPYVFDDHELESVKTRLTHPQLKYHLLHARTWEKWENAVDAPIITVSERIAAHYRELGRSTYLVPNMPCKLETDMVMPNHLEGNGKLRSIYVGGRDFTRGSFLPHRNMEGFLDLFRQNKIGGLTIVGDLLDDPQIRSTGPIPHLEVMRQLAFHHIGIIPFLPNEYHAYCNVNKAYEYVNAGLLVLVTCTMTPVIRTLGSYCISFADYDDLFKILSDKTRTTKELVKDRPQVISYARSNFVWEKYENNIYDAYKNA